MSLTVSTTTTNKQQLFEATISCATPKVSPSSKMPTWQQIQAQLRNPNNPVVFIDVTVGTMVRYWQKPETVV